MTTVRGHVEARVNWLPVWAVTAGTFLLVTAEQLPIGLLTGVGDSLSVSEGTAGLLVTVPSLVAAIAAPVVPLLIGTLDRRLLLAGLMALMTAANVVSALAPNYPVLIGSRFLVGVAVGGFWAVAGGLAVRLVPPAHVARATAVVFGGVGAANVLGVPIGALLGTWAGWRVAFAALGALALVTFVVLLAVLPPLSAAQPVRLRELAGQLANRGVRIGIVATLLVVTGHFCAYTFMSPVLQDISGVDERFIGALLFGFGAAGIIGNFVAGALLPRSLYRTVAGIVAALAVVLLVFPVAGGRPATGIGLLVAWGLAYGGVSVSLQSWMMRVAPRSVEAATALWVATFNLAIGLGALGGAVVIDTLPLRGVLLGAGGLLLLAGCAVLAARRTPALR
ncbi:major facilitator superfamily MFS_1 [Kribbella flavida DSM 17836]|uniref:Major facilitator superfamily MFS_1 n=1 Tax=Kribbella flavida (strain DSM 17836 / JCM 10339 / NBRC 14399) TaxID=479435 RepID=D2PMA0_KRIFD|nr:MFS transporter [Kribbella flavida]ADB34468.1 major facilitator superfamily MFS_1 [Kribbella flavida DSM 17836]